MDWRHLAAHPASFAIALEIDAGCANGGVDCVFGHGGGEKPCCADMYKKESLCGLGWSFVGMSERKTPEVAHCVKVVLSESQVAQREGRV